MKTLIDINESTKDEVGCTFKLSVTYPWKSRVLYREYGKSRERYHLDAGECSITRWIYGG